MMKVVKVNDPNKNPYHISKFKQLWGGLFLAGLVVGIIPFAIVESIVHKVNKNKKLKN